MSAPASSAETKSSSSKPFVAVITGANRGIGLGFVKPLLDRGYVVFATARQPSKAAELVQLQSKYR